MIHRFNHPFLRLCILTFLCSHLFFTGCDRNEAPNKTNDLEFTVVSGTDIPEELQKLIEQRQENTFELTFSDDSSLYVIKGYGKQASGGYSIVVHDFYQAGEQLVFDTELFGPKKDEPISDSPSYPYIVIKTEYRENPVVFR